jgi:hypothetical protein
VYVCRYNKLGLDKPNVRVDEVHSFLPVESPLNEVKVKLVSLGTSHSALVTGQSLNSACTPYHAVQYKQVI